MAELLWIVPARRAVVAKSGDHDTATLTWSAVHAEWVSQLRTHRAVLLGWYAPLDPDRSAEALGTAFDAAVEQTATWHPDGPRLHPPHDSTAHATTDDAETPVAPEEIGMHVRLWKGPLRVTSEIGADSSFLSRSAAMAERLTELTIGSTTLRLKMNTSGEVLNEDAEFIPGDVLEFPIFKLWWLCAIERFYGSAFHPTGTFFLGTAVHDGQARLPGTTDCTLWLHDNILAMRFQLILNIASGGWPSLEPPFGDAYRMDHVLHGNVLGRDLYARGMVYGGSFANPRPPVGRTPRPTPRHPHPDPPPPQDRYWFRDNNWGTGSCVPVLAAAESFRSAHWNRLTWGWACTPCALTLAYYMLAESGWAGGGSVNAHAREQGDSAPVPSHSHTDYFHNQMFAGESLSRDEVTAQLMHREGTTSTGGVAYLRRAALNQLFGRPRTDGQATTAATPLPTDDFVGLEGHHLSETDRDEIIAMGVDRTATDDEHVLAPESEIGAGQADAPVQAAVADDFTPGADDRDLGVDAIVRYVGGCWASVSLNGHEYSYVHLEPHSNLTAVASARRSEVATGETSSPTLPSGPPIAGFVAAYDPLTGRSFATSPTGDVYIYEATGTFGPSNQSAEMCAITTFTARSHRFERVEHWYWRQSTNGTIYLGERDDGVVGTHTRRKHLVSITRFDPAAVEAVHAVPRSYFPISLHSRTQAAGGGRGDSSNLDDEMLNEWYAFRAVPYPTAKEADEHSIYPTISATRDNLVTRRSPGTAPNRTLRDTVERGRGDLSAWGRDLVRGPPEAPNESFGRQVAQANARLAGYYRDRPRQVTYEITQLKRQVRGRGRDDSDAAVRLYATTARRDLDRIDADLAPLESELAALRAERTTLRARYDSLRRGDPERARIQERLNVIWAQVNPNPPAPTTRGRHHRDAPEPNLAQRVAAARRERERLTDRTPEFDLVPLLDERDSGRWASPPTSDEIRAQAEEEVFRTYALRWQKIVRDIGATDVRGDDEPAR